SPPPPPLPSFPTRRSSDLPIPYPPRLMSRLTALVLVLLAGLLPAPAGARRNRRNDLIRVTSPPVRGTASAHPFVNVIVFFDSRRSEEHTSELQSPYDLVCR